jgi:hypothetical protein
MLAFLSTSRFPGPNGSPPVAHLVLAHHPPLRLVEIHKLLTVQLMKTYALGIFRYLASRRPLKFRESPLFFFT